MRIRFSIHTRSIILFYTLYKNITDLLAGLGNTSDRSKWNNDTVPALLRLWFTLFFFVIDLESIELVRILNTN